jgi:hypothetical protein
MPCIRTFSICRTLKPHAGVRALTMMVPEWLSPASCGHAP